MSQQERLDNLYADYEEDPDFDSLRKDGIRFVAGHGPLNPDIMIIGEEPGRQENAYRKPFVGRAGKYLDHYLRYADVTRSQVFLTNIIKYWPLDMSRGLFNKTRPVTEDEIAVARDYIIEEVEIVNPKVVGLCGRFAIRAFYPNIDSVIQEHGNLIEGKFVPLYHPAVTLYHPEKENILIEGYTKLGDYLKENMNKRRAS